MMEKQNILGQYIKAKRKEKDLSLRELEETSGISRTYLSILERGADIRSGSPVKPTLETLKKLARGLGVSLEELIYVNNSENIIRPAGAVPFSMDKIHMIPVLGLISAGKPDITENLINAYWPMDMRLMQQYCSEEEIKESFYLSVKGNSLLPIVREGDMVLVVPQPVENGDVALVMFGENDACLKVVNYTSDGKIILISTNPDYMPISLFPSECHIIGKVLLYIGHFKKRLPRFYVQESGGDCHSPSY